MIISGGSRSNARYFAAHLMRADENERVSVTEIRGLPAQDVRGAFQAMEMVASGTRCKNHFYHAALNPREDEHLTAAQWEQAVDTLEHELHLDGHSRFVVEHEKDGRTHRHVIWSRIDADTMTAVSDSHNYKAHETAARALEKAFGHEPVRGVHVDLDGGPRPERRPKNWETFRGHESGRDPQDIKAELTALWQAADSGPAFAQALADAGYILAKGDRRDFCVVDSSGDAHSLARRIQGAKTADIRARMEGIDRDALPTVAEACAMARADADAGGTTVPATPAPEPEREARAEAQRELSSPSPDAFAEGGSPSTPEAAAPDAATPPPPELTPLERLARDVADAAREQYALTSPPEEAPFPQRDGPLTALENLARDMSQAMREEKAAHGDGLTWWERAIENAIDLADEVTEWAKERWTDFVERLQRDRDQARDAPEMELDR